MTYRLGPVVAVTVYQRDLVVHRQKGHGPQVQVNTTRSAVAGFSRRSMRRLAFVVNNTHVAFPTMMTLTYPNEYPADGRLVKGHLQAMLKRCWRRWAKCSYLWFLEFQRRGAPHYHILFSYKLSEDLDVYHADIAWCANAWYAVVGSDDEKHLKAGTRLERIRVKDGGKRYALKYAMSQAKAYQKCVPVGYESVGRVWGHSRDVVPEPQETISCGEAGIRAVLEFYGWPYAPDDDDFLFRVLFNAADVLP